MSTYDIVSARKLTDENARLRAALYEAATSLETLSRWRAEPLADPGDVFVDMRGYAHSRATCARAALASSPGPVAVSPGEAWPAEVQRIHDDHVAQAKAEGMDRNPVMAKQHWAMAAGVSATMRALGFREYRRPTAVMADLATVCDEAERELSEARARAERAEKALDAVVRARRGEDGLEGDQGEDLNHCGGCGDPCVIWREDRQPGPDDPCCWIRDPGIWLFDCKRQDPRSVTP